MTHPLNNERHHMKKLLLSAVLLALAVPAVASAAPKHSLKVKVGQARIQKLANTNKGHNPAFVGACHHARSTGLFSTVDWMKVRCQVVIFTPVAGTKFYEPHRFVGTSSVSPRGRVTTSIHSVA